MILLDVARTPFHPFLGLPPIPSSGGGGENEMKEREGESSVKMKEYDIANMLELDPCSVTRRG